VLAARIKGVGRAGIVWRHALPNIAVPLVTVVLLTYATNLEGAIVTEIVQQYGGELWLDTSPELGGLRVTVELPRPATPSA